MMSKNCRYKMKKFVKIDAMPGRSSGQETAPVQIQIKKGLSLDECISSLFNIL